jgi:small subunit ribosomal protein S16
MVKIRLSRGGAKKQPFYHIVVADERRARDGRSIERLGFFNPVARGQEERLRVDLERVDYWKGVGAQVTDRVKSLVAEARSAAS